ALPIWALYINDEPSFLFPLSLSSFSPISPISFSPLEERGKIKRKEKENGRFRVTSVKQTKSHSGSSLFLPSLPLFPSVQK
ncbi:MAG: hypothetical protein LBC18_15055, partial [Opitutaceae bacterium]|nr:hypothetical protein [Opitutaceae bacterium]